MLKIDDLRKLNSLFVCEYFKESYEVLGIDKYVDLETGEMINRIGE